MGGSLSEAKLTPTQAPLVYIADDSDLVRHVLVHRLTAAGLQVQSGGTAADSRRMVLRSFACALLDLDLGDGDGVAVAELLRAHQPALPVAFFSGGATATVMERAKVLGPMFRKPDELEAAVSWVLGRARGTGGG